MRERIKLALRRWAIRRLIKLVDRAEEWLQEVQVKLRNDLVSARVSAAGCTSAVSQQREFRVASPRCEDSAAPARNVYAEWEARRSGVAVISKKQARQRRHATAADFDRRFA